MAGPFDRPPASDFFTSPIGAVPKKGTDEYRRIHDLSHPHGASLNDAIVEHRLRYVNFDAAAKMATTLGRGALLAKLDVKTAFRCVAVHPSDRKWLGLVWRDKYYADLALPFGMRSSPALWEQYATFAEWIVRRAGVRHVCHYVDDFLVGGPAASDECAAAIALIVRTFGELGIPINREKLIAEGTPATIVRFLGILIDTVRQIARLDDERVAALRSDLKAWSDRDACTRSELESLIGTLAFAAKVVPAGRTFLRRMIDLLPKADRRSHHIKLNATFRADLHWWRTFVIDGDWNGVSLLLDPEWTQPPSVSITDDPCPDFIFTDASGAGFGAVFGRQWLHGTWSARDLSDSTRDEIVSSAYVEMRAVAIALATWGPSCRGRRITIRSDSLVAVQTFTRKSAHHPALMHMIRTILFLAASHQFAIRLRHIDGVANVYADMLSRGQIQAFRNSQSTFDRSPTAPQPLPPHIW